MVEPIASATVVPPVVPAQATEPANSATQPNQAGNVTLTQFEQAAALQEEDAILNADLTASASSNGAANNDGTALDGAVLASLSSESLIALSDANASINSPANDGTLTPAQAAEISTLRIDAQLLNAIPTENVTATETFSQDGSLLEGASTVNLSSQAVNILNEVNGINSAGVAIPLTTAQLQQIAGIIAPFINVPLTPSILTQIQNALLAAGFNPTEISLQNLFLSMSYVGELFPSSSIDNEQLAISEAMTTELLDT